MVKQSKKLLIITIIMIILFESIFSTNISFAAEEELAITPEMINTINNLAGGLVSILFWRYRATLVLACFVIDALLNSVASQQGVDSSFGQGFVEGSMITPFDIFFNRYKMLDINVFDINGVKANSMIQKFRKSTAMWYYTMRTLAAAILLVILIYVGIRMLLASVAEERAKYKKMLFDWICSLLLLFLLQYMAIFIIYLNNAVVSALRSFVLNTNGGSISGISSTMVDLGKKGALGIGMGSITAMLAFAALVITTVAFFIAYLNRMFKVAFLIMISPLITITYSIDKIGDGKAQALGNWLKQYLSTVIIQPFHCVIYISFVQTAFNIINASGTGYFDSLLGNDYNEIVNCFLALICLLFIFQCEGIVRNIFGIKEDKDTSALAGVVLSMAALSKAKQVGGAARKGLNSVSSLQKKASEAFVRDNSKLKKFLESNPNNKLARAAERFTATGIGINDRISNISSKVNRFTEHAKAFTSLPGKKLSDWASKNSDRFVGKAVGKTISGFKHINDLNKTMSVAATLGAITSLASGGSVLEAAKAYDSISEGAKEFNTTSKESIADMNADLNEQMDDTEYENKTNQLAEMDSGLSAAREANEESFNRVLAVHRGMQAQASQQAYQEEIARLEEQRRSSGNSPELQRQIDEATAKAESFQHDIDLGSSQAELSDDERVLLDNMQKRDNLKEEIEHFYDGALVEARARARQDSVSTSSIQSKKNRIIAILSQLKVDRGNGVVDVVADNEYAQDTIGAVMASLTADMQKSALTASGFNGDEKMGRIAAALHVDDTVGDNAEQLAHVRALLGDLDNMYKQKEIATNTQRFTSVGGNQSALASTTAYKSSGRAKGRLAPSFSNIEDL